WGSAGQTIRETVPSWDGFLCGGLGVEAAGADHMAVIWASHPPRAGQFSKVNCQARGIRWACCLLPICGHQPGFLVFRARARENGGSPQRRRGFPMSCQLKPGDRVRVTVRNRMHGYQPGDKGAVLREIADGPSGACCYVVVMDKDAPSKSSVVFSDDEIEPDT